MALRKISQLSFTGAGFAGIYHFGVIHTLRTHQLASRHLVSPLSECRVAGASAGALAAACVVNDIPTDVAADAFHALSEAARAEEGGITSASFDLSARVRALAEDFLPRDAHIHSNGKLFVSVTQVPSGTKPFSISNNLISYFPTRDDLIKALEASCFIPVFSQRAFKTELGLDGGFTNNTPEVPGTADNPEEKTVKVSVFNGRFDICPPLDVEGTAAAMLPTGAVPHFRSYSVSSQNLRMAYLALVPGDRPTLERLFEDGVSDAARFLVARERQATHDHAS